MKNLKLMLETVYSIDAIFKLRKTPILISLVFLIFLSFILMTPFAFVLIGDAPYRWDEKVWSLTEEDYELFDASLPKDAKIIDNHLNYDGYTDINLNNGVRIVFNGALDEVENGIIFNADELIFVENGRGYSTNYTYFKDIDFSNSSSEDIFSRVASSIKPIFIMSFVLGAYQTGVLSAFIFSFVVAALSMLLKFGHTSFLTYKEVLNIIIYSSTLPCVLAFVIGMFNVGLTMVIYNVGAPLMAYVVYKRRVIPYLINND